jgi:4-amino-4-deoxy-L-arabinose transferase-like glycosyltransferase
MERLNFINKPIYSVGLIALLSLIMHFEIFTLDLQGVHLWRQSQTQINIQNFYRHDNNIFNPRNSIAHDQMNIQRLEFPIMQWIIAQFHRIFGESIIITRISIFTIGILSVLGIFQVLQILFKNPLLSFLTAYSFNFLLFYNESYA